MNALHALTIAALTLTGAVGPVSAAETPAWVASAHFDLGLAGDDVERRGRKRPRVPGGSGCDDPRDLIEHPACRA